MNELHPDGKPSEVECGKQPLCIRRRLHTLGVTPLREKEREGEREALHRWRGNKTSKLYALSHGTQGSQADSVNVTSRGD